MSDPASENLPQPSSLETPIRRMGEGIRFERERYQAHLAVAEELPFWVKDKEYTLPWPIDMSGNLSKPAHISWYGTDRGDYQLPAAVYSPLYYQHGGIDIQVDAGTQVISPVDAIVVEVENEINPNNQSPDNTHVVLLTRDRKLLLGFGHIDRNTLSPKLKRLLDERRNLNLDKFLEVQISEGEPLGKVWQFPDLDQNPVEEVRRTYGDSYRYHVPVEVEAVYGRAHNHLHFHARADKNGSPIDPHKFVYDYEKYPETGYLGVHSPLVYKATIQINPPRILKRLY